METADQPRRDPWNCQAWQLLGRRVPLLTLTLIISFISSHLISHLSLTREGRSGTADDFATSFGMVCLLVSITW